ncbi:MAG: hypothetical protein DRQ47_02675 [Gammaproteobacteria bacterium]|nr:MAG: hypothetical protein DRQ47_02675 [Gammaproteobacteria bacterium]
MNTVTNSLSKYEDYPFTDIITVSGVNYGVTDTTLYNLGGDTDSIDTPIQAEFTIHSTDFESLQTKNVPYAYIGARSEGQFEINTLADERTFSTMTTMSHGRTDLFNWRAKFGRGVKAVNWGFSISNVDGNDFQIQTFSSDALQHNRKI